MISQWVLQSDSIFSLQLLPLEQPRCTASGLLGASAIGVTSDLPRLPIWQHGVDDNVRPSRIQGDLRPVARVAGQKNRTMQLGILSLDLNSCTATPKAFTAR